MDEEGDGGEGSSSQAEKIVYVLHPNCAVEQIGEVKS
jgi:hypothetical protein